MLTHGISPALRDGVYPYHQGQSRLYQVITQLRADGVHCRKYGGTGPVVLKVVPPTGAAFSGITMYRFISAILFPTLARGQLNREGLVSLFLFAPENSVSLDSLGRPIPRKSAYSLNIGLNLVLNHGIFPAFHEGVNLYRQPPSGQSRVYRVTQLRTDGVHTESSPAQVQ